MLISIIKLGINYFGNKIVNKKKIVNNKIHSIAVNADLATRIKVNYTKMRVNCTITKLTLLFQS